MRIYYAGSEVSSWRKLLAAQHVPAVALSYMGLRRRCQFKRPWLISTHYPEGQAVFLDSGCFTLNRDDPDPDTEVLTREAVEDIATHYMSWAMENIGRVAMVSEFDAEILGHDNILTMRRDFWEALPSDKFLPMWHGGDGLDELDRLASSYPRVGVVNYESGMASHLNMLVSRYGVKLHAAGNTSVDAMREVRWDSVSSTSWFTPASYGETHVWNGRKLIRYPKTQKDQARKRHRTLFAREGFDVDKIMQDDRDELLRLSLWSWNSYVDDINGRRGPAANPEKVLNPFGLPEPVTDEGRNETTSGQETGTDPVADSPKKGGTVVIPDDPRPTVMLPLMKTVLVSEESDSDDAAGSAETVPVIQLRSESMRMCDSCYLAQKCPAFESGQNCAYNIPIEVTTSVQLKAVRDALITMQTQRVLMMVTFEQVEGGYVDSNTSAEMRLLQKMIKDRFDAEREGFTETHTYSAQGGPGFMTKNFGADVGSAQEQLPAPQSADAIMRDEQQVYEAEVVQDQ